VSAAGLNGATMTDTEIRKVVIGAIDHAVANVW
jgi:hypothetical protein